MANRKWPALPAGRQIVIVIVASLVLGGCMTAKKVVRERVDQQVSGNQGVIYGDVPPAMRPAKTTREYIQIDVDLDETFSKIKEPFTPKQKTQPAPAPETVRPAPVKPAPAATTRPAPAPMTFAPAAQTPAPSLPPSTYTVKPDQSLSTIAKELYGDGSKWDIIYEANRDKIKNPNKIKAGMTLVIPQLTTSQIKSYRKAEK
ncbi:MAG: LysM peptidoglycan-binding domain-containing protein [Candidatus Omnitrophota bacterium]